MKPPGSGRRPLRLLFAVTALAVIVPAIVYLRGALGFLRQGTQTSADAAALAAGAWLLTHAPPQQDGAAAEAIRYASLNTVLGYTPQLRREDVVFDEEAGNVSVLTRVILLRMPPPLASMRLPDVSVTAHAVAEGRIGGMRPTKVLRLLGECPAEPAGRRAGSARPSMACS